MSVRADARRRARANAYRLFYRLPFPWRRALVRLVSTKYTVGAVTLVHDADATGPGRLLLLRQPSSRGWSLPGGLLKANEDPATGAARELEEEAGVSLTADQLSPAVPNALVHPDGHWVDMVFEARIAADSTFTVDGGEVLEAAWQPLDALPRLSKQTALLLGFYGIGPHADRLLDRRGTHGGAADGDNAGGDNADGGNAAAGGDGAGQTSGRRTDGSPDR